MRQKAQQDRALTTIPGWTNEQSAFYGTFLGVLVFAILFFARSPKMAFAPAVLASIIAYVTIAAMASQQKPRQRREK